LDHFIDFVELSTSKSLVVAVMIAIQGLLPGEYLLFDPLLNPLDATLRLPAAVETL
jgi:hypothetical protein